MAGGQVTYEFGYCPYNYAPLCCAVVVSPLSLTSSKIWAYAAVKRLLVVLTAAVAFQLRSMNRRVEDYRLYDVIYCIEKTLRLRLRLGTLVG